MLPTPILTAGVCVMLITGCGKNSTTKKEVSLEEMNRAVGLMLMSPRGAPRQVEDLTNFPAFKGRPFSAPPAGKKFAVDPTSHLIIVVDQ